MNKLIPLATAAALSVTALAAEARISSTSDFRGYEACVNAAERSSNGLVPARQYLIERDGANALYYINATRWQDGERDTVRIACETANRGHTLVSSVIEQGKFSQAPTTKENVELAAQ